MICDNNVIDNDIEKKDDKTMIILVKYVLHLYISKQNKKKSLFVSQTF